MGSQQSCFRDEELRDYQSLTFLSRQEIVQVEKRFLHLVSENGRTGNGIHQLRLSKEQACKMTELNKNPFRERIVEVFSSQNDDSLSFEDFLDMINVFSKHAPKSVKVAYAFKIYQGINTKRRPEDHTAIPNTIDLYDVKEIIRRLSGNKFHGEDITKIAEAVIKEVDLRGDKIITSEIFEYFLSNVPDFPSTFVIPLSDAA